MECFIYQFPHSQNGDYPTTNIQNKSRQFDVIAIIIIGYEELSQKSTLGGIHPPIKYNRTERFRDLGLRVAR